jgi:hypothetical protein
LILINKRFFCDQPETSAAASTPPKQATLLVVLTQQLAGFSIDQVYSGAGGTGDRLVLVFGNIWIVIQLVLDVETGCRAPENEVAHLSEIDDPATPDHDLAQGFAARRSPRRAFFSFPCDVSTRKRGFRLGLLEFVPYSRLPDVISTISFLGPQWLGQREGEMRESTIATLVRMDTEMKSWLASEAALNRSSQNSEIIRSIRERRARVESEQAKGAG